MKKYMNTNRSALAITSACLFWISACGLQSPEVKKQSSGRVDKPEFPSVDRGFKLNSQGETNTNYEGPIVFWQNDIDPQPLQKVLQQSLHIKEIDARFKDLKFKREKIDEEIKELEDKLYGLSSDKVVEEKIDQFFAEKSDTIKQNVVTWFNQNLDPAKKQEFHNYCEARLWQFASSSLLRDYEFTARPSPLVLCEDYYQNQLQLFKGEECAAAAEDAGTNYFACYWGQDGILKSTVSFNEIGSGPVSEETLAQIASLFSSPEWKKQIGEKLRLPLFYLNEEKRIVLKVGNQVLSKILNKSLSDFLQSSDYMRDVDEMLKERLSAGGESYTMHDRFFNIHLLADGEKRDQLNLNEEAREVLKTQSIHHESEIPLEEYQGNVEELEREREAINTKIVPLKQRKDALVELEAQRQQEWFNAKVDSGWYILKHDMAHAIFTKALINLQVKDSVAMVTLQLDYSLPKKARGCFHLDRQEEADCPQDVSVEEGQEYLPLSVAIDPETSLMTLEIKLDDPEALGMTPIIPEGYGDENAEKGEPRYQAWEVEQLVGKRLSLELYPREYNESLSILTGKAFLYEGDNEWAQASVNLSQYGEL